MYRASYLALAITALTAFSAPAFAIPQTGLYFQSIPGEIGMFQTVAEDGILQVDYLPTTGRSGRAGAMQILQAAIRAPLPLFDSDPVNLRGLFGYRQNWAYYEGGQEDTYGGIEAGLAGSLQLGTLPLIGDHLKSCSLQGYGAQNHLIGATSRGVGISVGGLALPIVGLGIGLKLPSNGQLYIGYEALAVPLELGSGTPQFSNALRNFQGLAVGYRW